MGRRRLHDERTGAQLLGCAEAIVEAEGLPALSLRRLADETGVSSRAVYSLFGSKNALVAALGARAFDRLAELVADAPRTDDPVADLVEAGAEAFRRLVVEHPVLFQIGVQGSWPPDVGETIAASARQAWQHLLVRTERLAETGRLGTRSAHEAAVQFHAMCEGLAAMETRGLLTSMAESVAPAELWRSSLRALVAGFAAS